MTRSLALVMLTTLAACGGDFADADHTHDATHAHDDYADSTHDHVDYAPTAHDHAYAPEVHDHDADYAPAVHDHAADYSPIGHDHAGEYVTPVEFNGSDNPTCADNAGAMIIGNVQLEFGCHESCDTVCANHAMSCERAYTVSGTPRTCLAVNNNESLMCWCTG